jgi:REP element-mobilizing transposase RayT
MVLWRLYYHIVWATKKREPLISHDIESQVYGYLTGKANHLVCINHAIGGVEDHIHLVISIPPKISIAECVKALKGSIAHYCNQSFRLVIQAGALGQGGEVFLLDMGEPVKIYDLAMQMIELNGLVLGKDIDITAVFIYLNQILITFSLCAKQKPWFIYLKFAVKLPGCVREKSYMKNF